MPAAILIRRVSKAASACHPPARDADAKAPSSIILLPIILQKFV
jgi:hypothetical protein